MFDWLSGIKTYLVCIAAILTALIAWLNGALSLPEFIGAVILAIQQIFQRMGTAKAQKAAEGMVIKR
jgi:hypothetical protein